jgi:Kdo2-lipid IVA lauroyltransferase/acyltransferase
MKYIFEYILLRILRCVLLFFSFRIISRIGSGAGLMFYYLGIRKSVARDNMIRAQVTDFDESLQQMIKSTYKNLGRTFTELLMNDRIHLLENRHFKWDIPDVFLTEIQNGAILVSGHIGNWELMGKMLVQKGVKLAVVVRPQVNPYTDRYINRIRMKSGMAVIYDHEVFKIRRYLEKKYSIALLADQDYGNHSIHVDFFGRSCRTPSGPARLALRLSVPVYLCTSFRMPSSVMVFSVNPVPVEIHSTINSITQTYTAMLESIIRAHPDQWLWHHKRWKVNSC